MFDWLQTIENNCFYNAVTTRLSNLRDRVKDENFPSALEQIAWLNDYLDSPHDILFKTVLDDLENEIIWLNCSVCGNDGLHCNYCNQETAKQIYKHDDLVNLDKAFKRLSFSMETLHKEYLPVTSMTFESIVTDALQVTRFANALAAEFFLVCNR